MLLGIDLGTSSVKAALLDGATPVATASRSYPVQRPHVGWAESPTGDWWKATVAAVRAVTAGRRGEVDAVGLSGQMHGAVVTDARGVALRPAILWADQRSVPALAAWRALDAGSRRRLANPLVEGMTGPTLCWLRDHEPAVYEAACWAVQPKDWLRARLTGEIAGDHSDASATLLYDLPGGAWATDVVDRLALRPSLLPPLLESTAVAGEVTATASDELGIRPGTPVAAGAADTAAATLGTGLVQPGPVQLTVGTGGQVLTVLAAPVVDAGLRTHLYRAPLPGSWYAMAATKNAGQALEWVRAVLGVSWDTLYAEAFAVSPGCDGVRFLPYLTGERAPVLDPAAAGAWTGLSTVHRRGHLLRAALEGVAFSFRGCLEALGSRGVSTEEVLLAGGGSTDPRWCQLLADVTGARLVAAQAADASARGAAVLGGLASGLADVPPPAAAGPVTSPGPDRDRYADLAGVHHELYRRLHHLPPPPSADEAVWRPPRGRAPSGR